MAKINTTVEKAGDRILSAVGTAQHAYITAVSSVADRVGGFIPELPVLPLAESLPTPQEVVTTTFKLADQALKAQKAYALNFVKALAPITEKVAPNTKSARKSTVKAAS
ncbi:MAG: hypothetical protein ABR548_07185 [Actinomycetota bacterium]